MHDRPRVHGVCDRCHNGQHGLCAEEVWDDEFEMVTECRCSDNDHLRPTM